MRTDDDDLKAAAEQNIPRCWRSFEPDRLIGTWSTDSIRASGHQTRANRPERWPHRDRSSAKPNFTLAAQGPSKDASTVGSIRGYTKRVNPCPGGPEPTGSWHEIYA